MIVGQQAFVSGFNEIVIVARSSRRSGAVLAFVLVRQSDFVASAPQCSGRR